jgi:hypothetical protein
VIIQKVFISLQYQNKQKHTDMKNELIKKLENEFKTYIYTEDQIKESTDRYCAWLDSDKDIAEKYSQRIDLLEKELQEQVDCLCKTYKITSIEFLDLLIEWESKN